MEESSKTKKNWGNLEKNIIQGKGIDIGCGNDPILPDVERFDIGDGDANKITRYVHDEFDYVYSSHCLEHMKNPYEAILEWWKLVKVGGHLIFIVPDEDLYEQGVFPSRFNTDHKSTFTISKKQSWSPVSINVLDLSKSLPNGEIINIELQDIGYKRELATFGSVKFGFIEKMILRAYNFFKKRTPLRIQLFDLLLPHLWVVDQTWGGAVAQIQCVVKKVA